MLELKVRLRITPYGEVIKKEVEILHTKTLRPLPTILWMSPSMRLPSLMSIDNQEPIVEENSNVAAVVESNRNVQDIRPFNDKNELSPNDSSGLSNSIDDHNDNSSGIVASPEERLPPVFTTDLYGCSSTSSSTIEDDSIPSRCQYVVVRQESTTWQQQHYSRGNTRRRRRVNDDLLIFPKASPPMEEIDLPSRRYQVEASMPLISSQTSAFSKIRSSSSLSTFKKSITYSQIRLWIRG